MGNSSLMSLNDFSETEKPMVIVFPVLDALPAFSSAQADGVTLRLDNVVLV
jgi:hypothetical protein